MPAQSTKSSWLPPLWAVPLTLFNGLPAHPAYPMCLALVLALLAVTMSLAPGKTGWLLCAAVGVPAAAAVIGLSM